MISYLPRIVIICVIHFNLSIAIVLAADDHTTDNIRNKIEVIQSTQTLQIGDARIASITVLPELYENNGYQPLWTNPANIDDLFNAIKTIDADGLRPDDYHFSKYTNANDTALKWALRFFGWPRLGAPGELGLTPEDLQHLKELGNTTLIDVAAAENAASGNGHGYFVKNPWVSTDLLLTLKLGLDPFKRGLRYSEVDAAWVFPESYPQKIIRVVEQNQ